jgi:hypothetical protein
MFDKEKASGVQNSQIGLSMSSVAVTKRQAQNSISCLLFGGRIASHKAHGSGNMLTQRPPILILEWLSNHDIAKAR